MRKWIPALLIGLGLVFITTALKYEAPHLWGFMNGLVCYFAGVAVVRMIHDEI